MYNKTEKKKKTKNFPIGPSGIELRCLVFLEKEAHKRASRQFNLQSQSLPWNRAVSNVSQSWKVLCGQR